MSVLIRSLAILTLVAAAACTSGDDAPPEAGPAGTPAPSPATSIPPADACEALSDTEVEAFAETEIDGAEATMDGAAQCFWPSADEPVLSLQVQEAGLALDPASFGLGDEGYRYDEVSGVGEEALAAIQEPDAEQGIPERAVAVGARSGERIVILSLHTVEVETASERFDDLVDLLELALGRL